MNDISTDDVQIVPITEEYIAGYHACLDAVARERRYLAFVEAPPLESTRAFVLSNITNGVPQFVALYGDEVVGWCDVSPLGWEVFAHVGRLGMGVRRDFRRRGIGGRLLRQTIRSAKELGLERIELEVFASNAPAIALYEQAGFAIEGVKKKARKLDGDYDDLVEMALFI